MRSLLPILIMSALLSVLSATTYPHPAYAQFIESPKTDTNVKVVEKQDPFDVAIDVINFFFALAFLISIGGFIYAGVRYIIAGGSEGILEKATATWIASLVGLVVSLLGYILLNVIKYYIR